MPLPQDRAECEGWSGLYTAEATAARIDQDLSFGPAGYRSEIKFPRLTMQQRALCGCKYIKQSNRSSRPFFFCGWFEERLWGVQSQLPGNRIAK